MTTEIASSTAGLLVDGTEYRGPATSSWESFVVATFTADPGAVARRLPSSTLHPVRWVNGQAVVMLLADDWAWTLGALPPVRTAEITLGVAVTYGRFAAVPVLPLAGAMLPLIGGLIDRRYLWGVSYLDSVVTNRVAAEVNRLMYSYPGSVAAVRQDRAPNQLRFTATDQSGQQIARLDVATGGRTRPVDQVDRTYLVRDGHMYRLSERNTGRMAMRMGRTSARLRLGHGHLAELVRSLGMSAQPVQALVETSLQLRDQAFDRLEPVERPSLSPTKPNPVAAPMIITNEDGSEETVNQLPEGLPFDASADFELTSTA